MLQLATRTRQARQSQTLATGHLHCKPRQANVSSLGRLSTKPLIARQSFNPQPGPKHEGLFPEPPGTHEAMEDTTEKEAQARGPESKCLGPVPPDTFRWPSSSPAPEPKSEPLHKRNVIDCFLALTAELQYWRKESQALRVFRAMLHQF